MSKDALTKCKVAVVSTVVAAVILIGLNGWLGHFAQAGQNTRSIEKTEEIQEQLVGLVDLLVSIHKDADAALAKVAELCRAGKLKDCDDCAAAGVELPACVK